MFRPRLRRRCLLSAGLACPFLAWALILAVIPTGWVKARLVARLEAATGRSVRIGSVRLAWNGHLKIAGLSLAERATPGNPWLQVAEARLDVHLGQVFLGRCQPGDVVVDGMSVRVWRRPDGRFEFGDLARSCPVAGPSTGAGRAPAADLLPGVNFRLTNATIRFADDPSHLRLDLVNVVAQGSYRALAVELDDLRGQINGGAVRVAGKLVRDPATPRFAAEVQASRVRLDRGLALVEHFVPLVARPDDSIGGLLNVRLAVTGRGDSAAEIRRTLTGHGSVLLDPIDLDGCPILAELRSLGDWPRENHVGAVSSNFTIAGGRVSTEDLTVRSTKIPLVVAGWTDFDGRYDYTTRVDKIIANLPREAKALLGELSVNLDELAGLRIEGVRDQVHLTLNGRSLAEGPGRPSPDQVRFRESARKIRDRFFR